MSNTLLIDRVARAPLTSANTKLLVAQLAVVGLLLPLAFQLAHMRSMLLWWTQNSGSRPAYGTAPMPTLVPTRVWMRPWMPESIARQNPCTPPEEM